MTTDSQATAESQARGLRVIFRALSHRNFKLFFSGQIISLVGKWMQMVARAWLVYRLTGSAVLPGLVGFAGQGRFSPSHQWAALWPHATAATAS